MESNYSEISGSVLDKPSPPQDLAVTEVSADSVTLSWKTPNSDGGSAINTYVIEKQDVKRGTWLNAGTVRVSFLWYFIISHHNKLAQ